MHFYQVIFSNCILKFEQFAVSCCFQQCAWLQILSLSLFLINAEILGALLSVFTIWLVTGVLVYLAVERLISDDYTIEGDIMLITSGCAVVANIMWVKWSLVRFGVCDLIKAVTERKAALFLNSWRMVLLSTAWRPPLISPATATVMVGSAFTGTVTVTRREETRIRSQTAHTQMMTVRM